MAYSDSKGVKAGSRDLKAFENARELEEIASEQDSNIEVGDFLSDLATAVKFRMKLGQSQGDWIEEPERAFTDGLVFATEIATTADVKLQISLCLDASTSMWMNRLMKSAGPAFLAFDRIIRKAAQDLPQGSISYAPFIFHEKAYKIPASYLNSYVGRSVNKDGEDRNRDVWPTYVNREAFQKALDVGELPEGTDRFEMKMSGTDTLIAPLFRELQTWEQGNDSNSVRIDIVLTDGVLENAADVAEATKIQEDRNGRLHTVLLNFLSLDQWSEFHVPDRCSQYAVTPESLDSSIRQILNDAISEMF